MIPLSTTWPSDLKPDPSLIPPEVRDRLAASTMDLIHGILNQPGGREALDAARKKYEQERAQKH